MRIETFVDTFPGEAKSITVDDDFTVRIGLFKSLLSNLPILLCYFILLVVPLLVLTTFFIAVAVEGFINPR